jgi:subtilisin family serine protease
VIPTVTFASSAGRGSGRKTGRRGDASQGNATLTLRPATRHALVAPLDAFDSPGRRGRRPTLDEVEHRTVSRRRFVVIAAAALVLPVAVLPAHASGAAGSTGGEQDVVLAVEVDVSATDREFVDLVDTAADLAEGAGGELRVSDDNGGEIVSVAVPASQVEAVSAELADTAAAHDVATAAEFSLMRTPRDPQYRRQATYLRQIGMQRAWNRTRGSPDVTIAVVDSGVATGHPDLRGKVVGRYNAVTGGRSVVDRDGHGTAVASIAAAATSNRKGIAGVGWKTSMLAVKVTDAKGDIWGDAVAQGIRWATRRGADVINLSLGSAQDDSFVRSAVSFALSRGVVVVAAVSNEGSSTPIYPAAYPGVLSVGATNGARLATFSDSTGRVAAPGVGLRAAVPGGYARVDGTSFATALVSGQAALVRAVKPRMSSNRVVATITRTSRSIGSGSSAADRVHVFDAVIRARGVARAPRKVSVTPRPRSLVVTWSAPAVEGRQPIAEYRVHVRTAGRSWERAATVSASRTWAVVRRLAPKRSYDVRVVAVNPLGVGVPRTVQGNTPRA